jgi:FtsZ-binding cell division protein ZapB
MIRIIPGFNNVQMDAQVNIVRMRFMLQDEIAELEEESYNLTQQAYNARTAVESDRFAAMATKTQAQIKVAMGKLLAMD